MELLQRLDALAEARLQSAPVGHGIGHAHRVADMVERLQEHEGGDVMVARTAALFHHVAGPDEGPEAAGQSADAAAGLLLELGLDESFASDVADTIRTAPLGRRADVRTMEQKLLWDADKLDMLGVVGISRLFAIGARLGAPLFGRTARGPVEPEVNLFGTPPQSCQSVYHHVLKKLPAQMFFAESARLARRRVELGEALFSRAEAEIASRR